METASLAINALSDIIQTLLIYGVSILIFIHYMKKSDRLEREALEKEHAYYHPTTGEFTWKESK